MRAGRALLVLASVGCGAEEPEAPSPEPAPPAPPTAEHMHEHFDRLAEARDAVIRGDLDDVRPPLRWLREHPAAEGLPTGWEPFVVEMRQQAHEAVAIDNAEMAGRTVAVVATRCGACHEALGVHVAVMVDPPAEHGSESKAHMVRHAWAAERMWDSLVAPAPAAWAAGAEVLLEEHLAVRTVEGATEPLPDEVKVHAERAHSLAQAGLRSESSTARAELYGQFIATCASCHQALDVGPVKPSTPDPGGTDD